MSLSSNYFVKMEDSTLSIVHARAFQGKKVVESVVKRDMGYEKVMFLDTIILIKDHFLDTIILIKHHFLIAIIFDKTSFFV